MDIKISEQARIKKTTMFSEQVDILIKIIDNSGVLLYTNN